MGPGAGNATFDVPEGYNAYIEAEPGIEYACNIETSKWIYLRTIYMDMDMHEELMS